MIALTVSLLLAISVPPRPARYVTDNAGVLDAARASAVNEKLAQFERETSDQLLVYVDRKLPADTTLEEFANESFHQWRVGQKGKDNGAILFIFIDDRKIRIEVGYGLEPTLTDAKSKQITSTVIKPKLQEGDYTAAVEQGADAIMTVARGGEFKGAGQTVAERVSSGEEAPPLPYTIAFFVALFFLLRWIRKSPRRRGPLGQTGWSTDSGSSFSDSSSDSSSDSGGFDGGGGDSGGGGASDGW